MSEIDATELVELEKQSVALANDPQFVKFVQLKNDLDARLDEARKRIQGAMELSRTKKISGEWGYITLVERTGFDVVNDELPPRFWKKVPDIKKIGEAFKLTGKPIKGTTPKNSTYLRIGIK